MSSFEDLSASSRRGELDSSEAAELERELQRSWEARLLDAAGRQFDAQDVVESGDEEIAARLQARWERTRKVRPPSGMDAATSASSDTRAGRRVRTTVLAAALLSVLASSAAATTAAWSDAPVFRAAQAQLLVLTGSPQHAERLGASAARHAHGASERHASERGGELERHGDAAERAEPRKRDPAADDKRDERSGSGSQRESGPGPELGARGRAVLTEHSDEPEPRQPPEAESLFRLANRARRGGRLADAAQAYESIIAQFPERPEALAARVSLGQLRLSRGRPGDALNSFASYLQVAPRGVLSPEARWGQAQALRQLGRDAEARRALRQLVEGMPNSPHAAAAERLLAEPSVSASQP